MKMHILKSSIDAIAFLDSFDTQCCFKNYNGVYIRMCWISSTYGTNRNIYKVLSYA